MACYYNYKGHDYTKEEIKRMIGWGVFDRQQNVNKAVQWLNDKLGMSKNQIITVSGLIDNKAVGRLREDGSMLLSSLTNDGTEYHEGFHRVFKMFLTESEQSDLLEEVKALPNWKSLYDTQKKLYPDKSDEVIAEEVLAEEYRGYVLQNGKDYVSPGTKSDNFFQWLLNFLKGLLGKKRFTIQEVFDNINTAVYATKTPINYIIKEADKRLTIEGFNFSVTEKDEILKGLTTSFMSNIFVNHSVYDLLNGKIDVSKIYQDSLEEILSQIYTQQEITDSDRLLKIYSVLDNNMNMYAEDGTYSGINMNSPLVTLHADYMKSLGVNLSTPDLLKDIDNVDGMEASMTPDAAMMKVSFEFDPKANMSQAIKLLLASAYNYDVNEQGQQTIIAGDLGIYESVDWNEAMNTILSNMAGTPANGEVFFKKLEELSTKHSFITDILSHLGGVKVDSNTQTLDKLKLRNEFIQAFAKNKYTFLLKMLNDHEAYIQNANVNEASDKLLKQWSSKFVNKYSDKQQLKKVLTNRFSKEPKAIAHALGIDELNTDNINQVEELLNTQIDEGGTVKTIAEKLMDIKSVLIKTIDNTDITLDKMFSNLPDNMLEYKVRTSLTKIAEVIAKETKQVDMMITNAEGKKVYNISLNTYQTIVLNTLNYVASGKDFSERMKRLENLLPHLINVNTFEQVGDAITPTSRWMQEVLNGRPIKLNVVDGINVKDSVVKKSLSEINESDLLMTTLNGIADGNSLSIKHSDRSTYFSYQYSNKKPIINSIESIKSIEILKEELSKYLKTEILRVKAFRNNGLGKEISLYNKSADNLTIFDFVEKGLGKTGYETLINTPVENLKTKINNTAIQSLLNNYINKEIDFVKVEMNTWDLSKLHPKTKKPLGISSHNWDKFKTVDNFVANVVANSTINHIEETKILIGDLAFYKNGADAYKRLSMQSSTGEILVVDETTNNTIDKWNSNDTIEQFNPATGEMETYDKYNKKIDGSISEINLEEFQKHSSKMAEDESMKEIFNKGIEESIKKTLIKSGLSEIAANKVIETQSEAYTNAYKEVNEGDGMSYINIFGYREMMHRAGKWTDGLENTFQLEMAVLTLPNRESLKDLKVYVSQYEKFGDDGIGVLKTSISAKAKKEFKEVRIFDDKVIGDMSVTEVFSKIFESFTPLKPQYTGAMHLQPISKLKEQTDINKRLNIIAGRKTAYMVLQPSIILGTKLQQLNALTLKHGVDAVHLGSAAKFGTIDAKSKLQNGEHLAVTEDVQQRGAQFYTKDGDFNYDNLNKELTDNTIKSYLDSRFMKHQLAIANKPKEKIKNSTQSAKILIGNLIVNGVPRDYSNDLESWNKLNEEQKLESSELYTIVNRYKNLLNETVLRNIDALNRELSTLKDGSVGDIQKLVDLLQKAAKDRNESDVVLDIIEEFGESKILEMLPNKSKIENILFSIVSNNVISFKRPGNAVPQITVMGMEDNGTNRTPIEGKDGWLSTKAALEFYREDDNGTFKPAETILPFPKKLFKNLLQLSGKLNIVEALDWLNDKIDENSLNFDANMKEAVTYKALRIPNQQLSSNDVFTVKRFTLPLLENYVVVPSEIVVKTGSDFDIDKLNMYFNNLDNNLTIKKSKSTVEKRYVEFIGEQMSDVFGVLKESLKDITTYNARRWGAAKGATTRLQKASGKNFKEFLDDIKSQFGEEIYSLISSANKTLKATEQSLAGRVETIRNDFKINADNTINEDWKIVFDAVVEYMDAFIEEYDVNYTQRKAKYWSDMKDDQIRISESILTLTKSFAKDNNLISFEDFSAKNESGQQSTKALQNQLLEVEKQILLHPMNKHLLLAPIVDDILSNTIVKKVIGEWKKKLPKAKLAKMRPTELVSQNSFNDMLSIVTNLKKSIIYIGGKAGVGQIATDNTGHSIATSDVLELNEEFKIDLGTFKERFIKSSLPFIGFENNRIDSMIDNKGQNIIETLSALLTSQVDGGKNPYPVEIGIRNQTLNAITYLVRRGVDPMTILSFMSQPLIQKYLQQQRINESLMYERFTGKNKIQKSPEVFLNKFINDNNFNKHVYRGFLKKVEEGELVFDTSKFEDAIKLGRISTNEQLQFLAGFNTILEHTKAFNKYKKDLTPDTKPLKDMNSVDMVEKNTKEVLDSGLIKNGLDYRKGTLKSFFKAREMYPKLYNKYYFTRNSKIHYMLKTFKDLMQKSQRGEEAKSKVRNTIDNDYILFLLHNFNKDFLEKKFSDLMTGSNSIAKQIATIQDDKNHKLNSNLFIKEVIILNKNKGNIDNFRLFGRTFNTLALNNLADAMEEIREYDLDLYKDIILANYYQQGLNISPFNFDKVIPVEYRLELLKSIIDDKFLSRIENGQFEQLFALNHPELFINSQSGQIEYEYYPKSNILINKYTAVRYTPLGSKSHLNYHVDSIEENIIPDKIDEQEEFNFPTEESYVSEEENINTNFENKTTNINIINNNLERANVGSPEELFDKIMNNWKEVFPNDKEPNEETKRLIADSSVSGLIELGC